MPDLPGRGQIVLGRRSGVSEPNDEEAESHRSLPNLATCLEPDSLLHTALIRSLSWVYMWDRILFGPQTSPLSTKFWGPNIIRSHILRLKVGPNIIRSHHLGFFDTSGGRLRGPNPSCVGPNPWVGGTEYGTESGTESKIRPAEPT